MTATATAWIFKVWTPKSQHWA